MSMSSELCACTFNERLLQTQTAVSPRENTHLWVFRSSLKSLPHNPEFYHTAQGKKHFQNIVGKEENAGNQYSLPFP